MRLLAKLGLVIGIIALFVVGVNALSGWWAGEEKKSAVVVVVDPPPSKAGVIPLRGRASLFAGEPHDVTQSSVAVDDAEEVNLEATEEARFELLADDSDGTRFFVYAWMEMSDFTIYCQSIGLPKMRYVRGDDSGWVDAETGKKLETLTVRLRKRCPAVGEQ
jgi:hypothetical protein